MSDPPAPPPARDVRGALHGSRLITLPHVAPTVVALQTFCAGPEPVLVEVGFDHGRRLLSTAHGNPGWRVVGLEIRRRRVAEAEERAARHGIDNLFVWRMDARTVFAAVIAAGSVDIVEVLFPDPWWNAGHREKRLLIQPAFLADCARALRPGGLLHIATDVPRYAEHVREALAAEPGLRALGEAEGAARRPPLAQLSRREWKCEREQLPVHRFYAEATLR